MLTGCFCKPCCAAGAPGCLQVFVWCCLAASSFPHWTVFPYIQASPPFSWAFQLCFRGLELQLCLTVVYVKLIYLAAVALCQGRGRLNAEAVRKLIAWWTAVTGESPLFASSNHICYQGFFLFAPFPLFELEEYQVYTRDRLGWLVPRPVSLACQSLHMLKSLEYCHCCECSLAFSSQTGRLWTCQTLSSALLFVLLVLMKSLISKCRAGSCLGYNCIIFNRENRKPCFLKKYRWVNKERISLCLSFKCLSEQWAWTETLGYKIPAYGKSRITEGFHATRSPLFGPCSISFQANMPR